MQTPFSSDGMPDKQFLVGSAMDLRHWDLGFIG
jgi:hypothetical protein